MHMQVTLYVTNLKALKALQYAARIMADAQESQPWNKDLTKAAKALRYAAKHLGQKFKGKGGEWQSE